MDLRLNAYCKIAGRGQVLLDAFAIKDVMAFRLYRIFSKIIAKSADSAFSKLLRVKELVGVLPAPQDEVWMTSHLPHASDSVKSSK